ncbi:hypothetical protein [Bacillus mycoides]|uniref:hypothetical protein n=1 Tax=Bacillus mycoides TaxID=1405 RepID=UPI001C015904|nr:hypothetical protein [Bacillus mycoides]
MKRYIKDPGGSKVIFDPGNGGAGFKKEPGGHRIAEPGGGGLKNNTDPGGW